MDSVEKHYEKFLAPHYTWMSGDYDLKVSENRQFFESLLPQTRRHGKALDLGCGSGFQSIALADIGFDVVAVDSSEDLISELRHRSGSRRIKAIKGDLRHSENYFDKGPYDIAVCMGDTLVHLSTFDEVASMLSDVRTSLRLGGSLVLSFRDLTPELKGIDRAIPVRLDDERLMSTFLEFEIDHVVVNDMIFVREDDKWTMRKSAYRKLRLAPQRAVDMLKRLRFGSIQQSINRGFSTITAIA